MLSPRWFYNGQEKIWCQPLVLELDKSELQSLGISLEVEGVNRFGDPGGMLVLARPNIDDILPEIHLMDGNSLRIVMTSFSNGPSVLTEKFGILRDQVSRLMKEKDIYQAEIKTVMQINEKLSNDVMELAKRQRLVVEASAVSIRDESSDEEQELSNSGEM